jgi:hypothetical protein
MELSDEAKAEIKAAMDILKSDGVHFTKAMEKHMKGTPPADPKPPVPKPGDNPPPPKAEPPADPPTVKKAGLWWGTKE